MLTFRVLRPAAVGLLAACVAALAGAAAAPASFPALDRPAVQVQAPERAVLLAAALAGARVVAVGERGIVTLSDDNARRWRQARSVPVGVTLTAVRFVDEHRGWAVGHGGVILSTEDGGETWTRQADGRTLAKIALAAAQARASAAPTDADAARNVQAAQQLFDDGPDKPLLDLCFSDARHGYVVGAYNLFFETEDGGRTWTSAMQRLRNPKALHLYAIQARGADLYIAGEQGQLHRSGDGGRSFAALASPYAGSWFSLAMTERAVVVAGLRGNVFRSTDRGQSWARLEGGGSASVVDTAALPDDGVLLLNQAGQILGSRHGGPLSDGGMPPLPQPARMLPLSDGALLVVGVMGVMRLPVPGDAAGVTR